MSDERAQAAALDAQILELIQGSIDDWSLTDAELNRVVREVFAYQCAHLPAYQRFAAARGVTPATLDDWRRLPAVPAPVYKTMRVATFAAEHTQRLFRSSGTTARQRATLELDTLALYDASLLPPLRRFLFPDGARLRWLALLPDPARVTDSSLAYMVGRAARDLAIEVRFLVADHHLDRAAAISELEHSVARGEPICLLGTAFAFVHLLDELGDRRHALVLPTGSRLMETGGFKGRSRTVERTDLYRDLTARLGIPAGAIVGEYGMTELGSQFYDDTLACRTALAAGGQPATPDGADPTAADRTLAALDDPAAPRLKHAPPWVRTEVVDPAGLEPVPDGTAGLLVHLDLTGRGSALRLLTEDVGRRTGAGIELMGRQASAEPRGCSLAFEEVLRMNAEN